MLQFLQENTGAFTGLFVMAAYWFVLNLRSVKSNVNIIDKMRVDNDMEPMADGEKRIVTKVLRTSVVNDSIGPFIGGIAAIVVTYLML